MEEPIESLLENARKGDERSFERLVKLFYQRTFNIAIGVVRDREDAEEVAQQSWVKVWKKLDTFKGDAAFTTWLFRITTFTAIDFIRRKQRLAEVEYLEEMESDSVHSIASKSTFSEDPHTQINRDEMKRQFEAALQSLSANHRTALTLREIEGLSYAEIAQIMDCKQGTVMSRIFNARKTIQAKLKNLL